MFCLGFFFLFTKFWIKTVFINLHRSRYWTSIDFKTMDSNCSHKPCRMDRTLDKPSWQKSSLQRLNWKEKVPEESPLSFLPSLSGIWSLKGQGSREMWETWSLCEYRLTPSSKNYYSGTSADSKHVDSPTPGKTYRLFQSCTALGHCQIIVDFQK